MQWLRENIFIRIVIPFITGIALAYYITVSWWVLSGIALAAVITLTRAYLLDMGTQFRFEYLKGIALAVLWIVGGYGLKYVNTDIHHSTYFGNNVKQADYFIGEVYDEPVLKEKTVKVPFKILSARRNGIWESVSGKAFTYFVIDSSSAFIKYGDVLMIENEFEPVKKDRNPHAIDYKFILNNKNIFYSAYIRSGSWTLLSHREGFDIYRVALDTRKACIRIFNRFIPDREAAAVAASLLLGYRGDMSYELQNAYTDAGVVHILAVSGMQVGLVFILFSSLLGWMDRRTSLRTIKISILIAALIFFTLITGMSGSVIRAAVMLTLVLIGKQLDRHSPPLNILLATAFLLILIQPAIVYDIGFQLSFFAVAGIILLQKSIRGRLSTNNKTLDYFLNATSVSLAAQAGTLPVILYYFQQFPVHFLLVNLIVIPLSGLIIYGLILLLALSFIHPIAYFLGYLLHGLINTMDGFVRVSQHFPFAVYYFNHFNILFLILSFIIMILLFRMLQQRRLVYLNYALAIIAVMLFTSALYGIIDSRKRNILVFESYNNIVFTIRQGDEAMLFYPYVKYPDAGFFKKYLERYFRNEGVCRVLEYNTDKHTDAVVNLKLEKDKEPRIQILKNGITVYVKGEEFQIFANSSRQGSKNEMNCYLVSEQGPLTINL